jgi:hypothetical protein
VGDFGLCLVRLDVPVLDGPFRRLRNEGVQLSGRVNFRRASQRVDCLGVPLLGCDASLLGGVLEIGEGLALGDDTGGDGSRQEAHETAAVDDQGIPGWLVKRHQRFLPRSTTNENGFAIAAGPVSQDGVAMAPFRVAF